jgi:uncharacterized protein (TIGR00251 family)
LPKIRISVTVSPGAARTELVGRHGDGWKVRVAAPPERGRANDALVELLAGALDVPRSSIRVVSGLTAKAKVVEVEGLTTGEAERRLTRSLSS